MTIARKEIVTDGEEGTYHCVARCVRRAFLCGQDSYTGKSYEHRKAWVKERLEYLAGIFGVEVVSYAVMSNHFHAIIRTRPDWSEGWEAAEVARRWLELYPGGFGGPAKTKRIAVLSGDAKRIQELRGRLNSVSWFMRCLNEPLARRANREDGCKGHFWEGRFKCQRLLDEASLLACLAYVDLNPVRAQVASTPESSGYTGAQERIVARQARARLGALGRERRAKSEGGGKGKKSLTLEQKRRIGQELRSRHADRWLCPIELNVKGSLASPESLKRQARKKTGGRRGILPITADEYLELLDWTGRELRAGKRGAIPMHLAPVLKRLSLDVESWVGTVQGFGSLFWRVAGQVESIVAAARKSGRRWYKGVRAGQQAFATEAS